MRFFIAKELIDSGESDTVLYADLNVQPEDREYLFDAQTLRFLDEYGFVNLRHRASENLVGGFKGFENKQYFELLKSRIRTVAGMTLKQQEKKQGGQNY